jgi:hypothetical protein
MGWSAGSEIFSSIIEAAKKAIPDESIRKEFYREIYPAFLDADWDTEDECFDDDPLFKLVFYEELRK